MNACGGALTTEQIRLFWHNGYLKLAAITGRVVPVPMPDGGLRSSTVSFSTASARTRRIVPVPA